MFNDGLFASACAKTGVSREEEILQWLVIRQKSYHYSVKKVALEALTGWRFNDEFGDLVHKSGKFFSIRGIEFRTSGDIEQSWQQPIIDQPEIGVLGFIAKKIGGVLHLLVQAKMEPGNVNMVQLSPTVQATRSNYTMVHGGKKPLYIEYFLGDKRPLVLYDQLQSEQGTRYFKKRNRNIIVEIPEESLFETTSDFTWMTIGQLQLLTRYDNLIHLDCRSILGGLSYGVADSELRVKSVGIGCGARIFDSMICDLNAGEYSHAQILSWLTGVKFSLEAKCGFIPLRDVEGWMRDGGRIRHRDNKYLSVVGVSVEAESREVSNWSQPLVKSNDGGIIGLVCQMRGGILHALVQALAEPGLIDIVELAPTVQCTPENYSDDIPAYVELVRGEGVGRNVVFDSTLSEEGGRFFHSQQCHRIVEIDADQTIALKGNYCWMTLRQLQECGRYNTHLNIEMRSILCCISPLISE